MQSSGTNRNILCDENQLNLDLVQNTDQQIIRSSQKRHFSDEIKTLERNEGLKKSSSIYNLGPCRWQCMTKGWWLFESVKSGRRHQAPPVDT